VVVLSNAQKQFRNGGFDGWLFIQQAANLDGSQVVVSADDRRQRV